MVGAGVNVLAPKAGKIGVAAEEPKHDEPNGDGAEDTPTLAVPDAENDPNVGLPRNEKGETAVPIVAATGATEPPNDETVKEDAAVFGRSFISY